METHFASAAETADAAKLGAGAPEGAPAPKHEVLDDAVSLWQSVRGLGRAHLKLATLEMRLTGESLVTMIAAGVMAAVLIVSAWLVLVAVAVLELVNYGFSASIAMLIAIAVNLFLAWLLYGVAHRRSQLLGFPATVRSLDQLGSSTEVGQS